MTIKLPDPLPPVLPKGAKLRTDLNAANAPAFGDSGGVDVSGARLVKHPEYPTCGYLEKDRDSFIGLYAIDWNTVTPQIKPDDVITVTFGIRGWFAVHLTWNTEFNGFWEPEQSGVGSYAERDDPELIQEAESWAQAIGVKFYPDSRELPNPNKDSGHPPG